MDPKEIYAGAYFLAARAHMNQFDKGGRPYMEHLERVAENFRNDWTLKTVAILHDILEDTWVTKDMLEHLFGNDIADAVEALTRKENQSYGDFIKELTNNVMAIRVKMVDLTDNMDLGRLKEINDEDLDRVKKYAKWRKYLREYYFTNVLKCS
jgi:(p)ppGpp synthase/HD superfamily hydrolase